MLTFSRVSTNIIHLYSIYIPERSDQLSACWNSLDESERLRADRFFLAADRQRFLIAHGLLRKVLSLYVDQPPEALQFTYGESGKPYVLQSSPGRVQFSLSHSRDCAVIAVTQNDDVGVDIEYIDPRKKTKRIAERYFSDLEYAYYHQAKEKDVTFYQLWTAREAFIKAKGEGLFRHAWHHFSVDLEQPGILEKTGRGFCRQDQWHLQHLFPCQQYVTAICWQGVPKNIEIQEVT
ncbi:MAG: 4'-phosphopantetheinyl transferase superfamily protein [Pseudomonadota bacterium]|nr:4'-phosphopantetheinyl transferase superfamily protein [Gammaproteobacteria bacterium]MBU1926388.1 4'-phosphopantetheinyl transferase superfamily protein [Gammaproteobacteria bacterium]MBU2545849.1 4'-phosphopantetheinyl transferase superfamily protein [Gammaproteobacteria bacterium]